MITDIETFGPPPITKVLARPSLDDEQPPKTTATSTEAVSGHARRPNGGRHKLRRNACIDEKSYALCFLHLSNRRISTRGSWNIFSSESGATGTRARGT